MSKVALIIIFNHKFERNLPVLRQIYSGRFDSIYFIMPFYTGEDKDVLPVYENSFYFQGYIAQALAKIKNEGYQHYIVIGDDLILNPVINQTNYASHFNLGQNTAFIPEVFLLTDRTTPRRLMRKEKNWFWNFNAVQFEVNQKGIEVWKELPTEEQARILLLKHGYNFEPILDWEATKVTYPDKKARKTMGLATYLLHVFNCARKNFRLRNPKRRTLKYPMVGSYSDIVIIPQQSVNNFVQYSGITAALNMFVEIAMPTITLLTTEDVKQESDLEMKGLTLWEADEISLFEKKFDGDISKLFSDFPKDVLYVHPVKLSKWK